MFTRQPRPDRCRWWPLQLGIGIVVATAITVAVVLVTMQPGKSRDPRRVMVSFVDKGDALAAQKRPPLAGTDIVRAYTRGALVLAVGEGVSNEDVTRFYAGAVLVEDDPLIEAIPLGGTGVSPKSPPQARGTAVAVIDRAQTRGTPDLASAVNSSCLGSPRGARIADAVGEPMLAVRALGVCDNGYASDIADAIVWAAGGETDRAQPNPTPARVLLLSMAHRGVCPSYLQTAVSRAVGELGALVVASAGDRGAESFPSNCAGVLSVGEAHSSTGMAHVRAETPDGPGYAAAWVASLAAGAWTGNTTAAAVRARLCAAATPTCGGNTSACTSVYGLIRAPLEGGGGFNSTCPIDTYQSGARCRTCPRGSYAARGWTRCEVCTAGITSSCGYDCLTCGIPR